MTAASHHLNLLCDSQNANRSCGVGKANCSPLPTLEAQRRWSLLSFAGLANQSWTIRLNRPCLVTSPGRGLRTVLAILLLAIHRQMG